MIQEIRPPLNCIVCGKELKPLDTTPQNLTIDSKIFERAVIDYRSYDQPVGGIAEKFEACFGSKHDGTVFQIVICDDCIDESKPKQLGNRFWDD